MGVDIVGRGISLGYDSWSYMVELAKEYGWHGTLEYDETDQIEWISRGSAREWGRYLLKAYKAAYEAGCFDESVSENWKHLQASQVLEFATDVLLKGNGFGKY